MQYNYINKLKLSVCKEADIKLIKKMKKVFYFIAIFIISFSMTSCYVHKYSVGEGSKTGEKIKQKNHFFIAGLAPGNLSNPSKMAGDAKNYDVKTKISFGDGLLSIITFGIYTPSTTVVTK